MAEKERKRPAVKRPAKKRTVTRRATKASQTTSRFFEGYGNEITGVILIGFGLLLTAGIFTDQTGRVGEFLKDLAIATFGSLGYLFPVLFLALGFAFILRKREFLMNRRTLGIILAVLSLLIALSVGHMYLLDSHSLSDALQEISGLRGKTHGGVFGYLLGYPLVKLFGEVGAYIFSVLGIILGGVLIFNTTLYDSLRKGHEVSSQVSTKISSFREKNNELKALEVKPAEGVRSVRPEESIPSARRFKNQIQAKPKSGPVERPAAEEVQGKLSLPAFLNGQPRSAHRLEGTKVSRSRFNIEVQPRAASPGKKTAVASGTPPAGEAAVQNPITVPYLESWNKVRDEKNPRPDSTDPKGTPIGGESEEAFERVFGNGPTASSDSAGDGFEASAKPGTSANADADPAAEDGAGTEPQADPLTEQEFSDYRRKKLSATDKPKSDKGRQIAMEEPKSAARPVYKYPGVALLKENMRGMMDEEDHHEILENARKLQDTLATFGVDARVIDVSKGPSVTRYEMQLKAGIKVSKVTNLSDDIALGLAATGVRIEAPIPGKAAVGIEIPNKETVPVFLREVIDSEKFTRSTQKLAMGLGKDISGDIIIGDIAKFPHVLIAGATGSGKSVCINALIVSLLYKYTPEEVRLIMVDPKMVELSVYNGIPHLLIPVVTDPKKAAGALNWAVNEMTRRYDLFNTHSVRNIEGYNDLKAKGKIEEKLPYIVIIVDELADLMMVAAGEVESYIARLAQMARAAGMHLVIATQRPSVDVITGVIKANIPSRISFAVSSYVDSKTILDQGGAEKLLGKGDMLYSPMGAHKPKRVQGAFISEEEVEAIVAHIKVVESEVRYDESIIEHIEKGGSGTNGADEESDDLFEEAVRIVMEYNQASTSFLQRRMRIGYNRAARIMDDLEQRGVISGPDGAKPRRVLWTSDDML